MGSRRLCPLVLFSAGRYRGELIRMIDKTEQKGGGTMPTLIGYADKSSS